MTDQQPQQQGKRKKQKTSFEIFDLPKEIIQLIVYFIPDDYLETYIDIPFIGEYAAYSLYHSVEIISSYSRYNSNGPFIDPKEYKYTKNAYGEPREKYERIDNSYKLSYEDYDFDDGISFYRVLTPNKFIQLNKKYPRFRPKVMHFCRLELFVWFHERYLQILEKLPRIDISFKLEDRLSQFSFDMTYNIYRVSDVSGKFPFPQVMYGQLLPKISSFLTGCLPNIKNVAWGENIQELRLVEASMKELPLLFPNLKRLRLFGSIDVSSQVTCLPQLPELLQFLQIAICEFDELDLSYLDNLREFVANAPIGVDRLDRFIFPLGIERIALIGDANCGMEERNLDSLDGIELYPNLKEFRVILGNVTKTSVFSNTRCFPTNLQKLDISLFDLCGDVVPYNQEPLVTIGRSFPIPHDLKVLELHTHCGFYRAEQLSLPMSLRVLSISNDVHYRYHEYAEKEDWSGLVCPDSLVELNLEVTTLEGISLPKSLHSARLYTIEPIKQLDLQELDNLVRLKIGYGRLDIFIGKLPSSLQILDLSDNSFQEVFIDAPNLKLVNLTNHQGFRVIHSGNFHVPDSVEVLALVLVKPSKIYPNILPILLRELYLKKSYITTKSLAQIELGSYKSLVKLDLLGNEISFLENHIPSSLQWLCLDGNPISAFASASVFSSLKSLQKLSMASTKINEYFQKDGNLLIFPSSLISLDLSDNELQSGVSPHLIFLTRTQLQEVCLVGNPDMTDAQIIVEVLKASSPDMVELLLDRQLQEYVREEGVNFLSFYTPKTNWWQ